MVMWKHIYRRCQLGMCSRGNQQLFYKLDWSNYNGLQNEVSNVYHALDKQRKMGFQKSVASGQSIWDTVIQKPDYMTQSLEQQKKFVDRVEVLAIAGKGGNGQVKVERNYQYTNKPVQTGGKGGNGGSIIFKATSKVNNLSHIDEEELKAQNGFIGKGKSLEGPSGENLVIEVPLGTQVHIKSKSTLKLPKQVMFTGHQPIVLDPDHNPRELLQVTDKYSGAREPNNNESLAIQRLYADARTSALAKTQKLETMEYKDQIVEEGGAPFKLSFNVNLQRNVIQWFKPPEVSNKIYDLVDENQTLIACRGGLGGQGNDYFHNQPYYHLGQRLEHGSDGEVAEIALQLQLVADVGIIGLPAVGKSSILKAITRANPYISTDNFTYLSPQFGNVMYNDGAQLKVVDIPRIIEEQDQSKQNYTFLRNIESTKALIYVVDLSMGLGDVEQISGNQINITNQQYSQPTAQKQLTILTKELKNYFPGLLSLPTIIVANKTDKFNKVSHLCAIIKDVKSQTEFPVLPFSALFGRGIEQLKLGLRKMVVKGSKW